MQDPEEYYGSLMNLFNEMVHIRLLHSFDCGTCACNISMMYAKDMDVEIFHRLLIGLDDEK